ncbi:MAG TPA: FRG domain-containing protein [Nitrospiraceae bacterium]|nr:FRG domain-containing protein [Nitrospiraceae bacterium]
MSHSWPTKTLKSVEETLKVLEELCGKRWLCRGHSKDYDNLEPTIDRNGMRGLSRLDKLKLERQSIELFRSTARFFASPGEQLALTDDIITLMVLRHYGVPTRLLDWSASPYVAAYFAVCDHEQKSGELWSFDEPLYVKEGRKQWKRWPETTKDGSGDPSQFDAKLTAFLLEEPPDWFCCGFYEEGFPRQHAQAGAHTITARFGRDHADAIANLLPRRSSYRRYIISASIKPEIRKILHDEYGIWRGSLFPDSAGAAEFVKKAFSPGSGL